MDCDVVVVGAGSAAFSAGVGAKPLLLVASMHKSWAAAGLMARLVLGRIAGRPAATTEIS
jgi:thioredoxin reductase